MATCTKLSAKPFTKILGETGWSSTTSLIASTAMHAVCWAPIVLLHPEIRLLCVSQRLYFMA